VLLAPHNSHRIHPLKASQGDEVAGAKQAEPEEARFERARPVLIQRESQSDSRQAPSTPEILIIL
jgi:hypothetical protein